MRKQLCPTKIVLNTTEGQPVWPLQRHKQQGSSVQPFFRVWNLDFICGEESYWSFCWMLDEAALVNLCCPWLLWWMPGLTESVTDTKSSSGPTPSEQKTAELMGHFLRAPDVFSSSRLSFRRHHSGCIPRAVTACFLLFHTNGDPLPLFKVLTWASFPQGLLVYLLKQTGKRLTFYNYFFFKGNMVTAFSLKLFMMLFKNNH